MNPPDGSATLEKTVCLSCKRMGQRIPDPRVKQAPEPRSGSVTLSEGENNK